MHSAREQQDQAHAAELESLKAVHAIALSELGADHASTIQSLEIQLQAAQAQVESAQSAQTAEASSDMEEELKKAKAELQSVQDELAGAKEVSTRLSPVVKWDLSETASSGLIVEHNTDIDSYDRWQR